MRKFDLTTISKLQRLDFRITSKVRHNCFLLPTVAAAALSAGALNVQALEETDRAMGAGSYVNPNGSKQGAWQASSAAKVSHAGASVRHKKR